MASVTPPVDQAGVRAAEAWRWLTAELAGRPVPPVIALIGLGDGALLDALDRHAPDTRVLALEPDPAQAVTFRSSGTCQTWDRGERLAYLAGPDYAGADEAWRVFSHTTVSPPVLLHPGLSLTPEVAHAAQVLKKILVGVAANREARRKFAPRYLINTIRNLPAIVAGSDVRHLTDAYRGVPAVVVAAGPSLDRVVTDLHRLRDRGLIIACDTALRPLVAAGIAPQLVVGVDPGELNARHLLSLPECAETWLVSESALDRTATAPFDGRTFWFHVSNHEPWPWLNETGLDVGQIDVWGSVLTAAFQVACLAGCDPIVIVGADLAFTDGRPYARGTTYELDWALGAAAGTALQDAWGQQIATRTLATVPDLRGRETTTTPALTSFRDWLVARAARSGRRVINASGAGIFAGPGVEQGTLTDALSRAVTVPPVATHARRHAGVRPTRLAAQLRDAHAIVAGGKSAHPLFRRWKDFSGDGFDSGALAAALDEAAGGLETKRAKPVVATLMPWARLAGAPSSGGILTRLPEAAARFRAAMSGVRSLPSIAGCDELTSEDRTALLHEALDLLSRIRDELVRLGDIPLTKAPWRVDTAGSLVYAWPESVRWSVVTFEALLGRAWMNGAGGVESGFFAGPVEPRGRFEALDGAEGLQPLRSEWGGNAYALLVREWLECWASQDASRRGHDLLARLLGLESAARSARAAGRATERADLALNVRVGDRTVSFELPLLVDEAALARVMTGIVRVQADVPRFALPPVHAPDVSASVRLSGGADASQPARRSWPSTVSHPRLFPDDRLRRSVIAYATAHGVVCVDPNSTASVLIGEDGHVAPHHRWPRPIVSELPFGEGGAIAWASGRAMNPNTPPYVMYRHTAAGEPIIEELPFTPSWGSWWGDRVYWSCGPAKMRPWRGIGSWAPGSDARFDVPDLSVFNVLSDDAGLLLDPATLRANNTYERRLVRQGFRWDPVHGLGPRELGPLGAAASRAVGATWTAAAFPEADVVELEASDGTTFSMTVYYPFRVAWLGRSLLVSTIDFQLLLFDRLADQLDALRAAARADAAGA